MLTLILVAILAQQTATVQIQGVPIQFTLAPGGPLYPVPAAPYSPVPPFQTDTRAQTQTAISAAACTLTPDQIPNNCLADCPGVVVCGNSLVQDANGVWSIHP